MSKNPVIKTSNSNSNTRNHSDESSGGVSEVRFTQFVDYGGSGLPVASGLGEVFSEAIVITPLDENEEIVKNQRIELILILTGDAYFDLEQDKNVKILHDVEMINGILHVGTTNSGYPIRVREHFGFYGVFTLQAVLEKEIEPDIVTVLYALFSVVRHS